MHLNAAGALPALDVAGAPRPLRVPAAQQPALAAGWFWAFGLARVLKRGWPFRAGPQPPKRPPRRGPRSEPAETVLFCEEPPPESAELLLTRKQRPVPAAGADRGPASRKSPPGAPERPSGCRRRFQHFRHC